jgi:hypothetical protein
VERNKWETAIRCLEVALHPATGEDEVIAGVNGFRRTAEGRPLSEVCAEFAGGSNAGADEKLDSLSRENLDLRGKLARQQARDVAALYRLHAAERLVRDLSQEIEAEKQSFADFRAASARIVEGLRDENFDLREALEQARLTAQQSVKKDASPFRELLSAALNPEREGDASAPVFAANPRRPRTA